MKKGWLAFISILIILIIALIFFSTKSEVQTEEVVLNDVLRLQQAQINSFDPLDAYHAGHIQIVKQVYNTLLDIDISGKPVASLAERWETEDGKIWRLYLRQNIYFADNKCFLNKPERLFTSTDVEYTFKRLLENKSESLGVSYFTNILGFEKYRNEETDRIEGIKTIDDYTIEFILEKEDYTFPSLLTLSYTSIVKKSVVEYYGETFKQNPVGTGPFILQNYEPDKKIVLAKNKDYWEKENGIQLPQIDKVVLHLTTDDNLALLMFKDKQTDILELSFPLVRQLKTMKIPFNYKTEIKENPQLNFYLINLEKIKDSNTRKAISYAINRTKLENILAEEGNIIKSFYPPSMFNELSSSKEVLSYKPDIAKKDLNDIKNLKLVCFEDVLSRSIADFIASSLKEYNIEVEIESVPFSVLVERLNKGEYDLIQIYWGILYADESHYLNPFLTSSFPPTGNNFNKYSNAEFDRLVKEAKTLTSAKRKENYLKAEDIILNDMPFILLYFKNTIRISNDRFEMPLHPLGYRLYKNAKKS
jgi:peptide/nickel transport system substrate-binding protein